MKIFLTVLFCFSATASLMADTGELAMASDCSEMSTEFKQFSSKLNATNKAMFCGKFNDAQRKAAMQLTGQMDSSGQRDDDSGSSCE